MRTNTVYSTFGHSVADAFKMVSVLEDSVINGNAYTHRKNYTFSRDQVRKFLYTPLGRPEGEGVAGFSPVIDATAGPILVGLYVNPTVTDQGTECIFFNRNGTSSNTASSTLRCDVVTSDDGTWFADLLNVASAVGVNQNGEISSNANPFNFRVGNTYLMVMTNTNGNNTIVNVNFNILEI